MKEFIQSLFSQFTRRLPASCTNHFLESKLTDSANIEQLVIILQYVFEGKPRGRLFKWTDCDRTIGDNLCNSIFKVFEKSPFNIKDCRSKAIDGVANMSGRNYVAVYCSSSSTESSSCRLKLLCTSHNFYLILCKCSKVPVIHVMSDFLKTLELFLKYSPKRSRRFQDFVEQHNAILPQSKTITKKRYSLLPI